MLLPFLLACRPDDAPTDGAPSPPTEPGPAVRGSASWCGAVEPGPPDDREVALGLSAAHGTLRLFGVDRKGNAADEALALALAGEEPWDSLDVLGPYAEGVAEACALVAGDALGPVEVEDRDGTAWIHPGTGAVTLPAGTAAVVVDLRGVPAGAATRDAVLAAAAAALGEDVTPPGRRVRRWSGSVDQVFAATNVYRTSLADPPPTPIVAAGDADLPLAFVVGERVAPEAASVAADLRLAGRASMVGRDLATALAEARWMPVGEAGLVFRTAVLGEGLDPVGDVIPADLPTDDPDADLADGALPEPGALSTGEAGRPGLAQRTPFEEPGRVTGFPGDLRASLLVAHGTWRRFFPYFEEVGDTIDEGLADALAEPPATTPWEQVLALARFATHLRDGHVFFGTFAGEPLDGAWAGYLGLQLSTPSPGDAPVVYRSVVPGIGPGDTLVSLGGRPIGELQDELDGFLEAATPGYTADLVNRQLQWLTGPTEVVVRGTDGAERAATAEPMTPDAFFAAFPTWGPFPERPSGRLDDLGAPGVAYLNFTAELTPDLRALDAAIAEAQGASGLVVDLRGYPAVFGGELARRLSSVPVRSALFTQAEWTGPGEVAWPETLYTYDPVATTFTGPLVVLTGPVSVSAAEDVLIYLLDARPDATVVGRQSAGTNGNLTGMRLPGDAWLSFTGLRVRWQDGSPFHGIGLVPDLPVVPTAADYAAGRDPELEAAVAALGG